MDKNTMLLLVESAMNNLEAIRIELGGDDVCDHSNYKATPDSTMGNVKYICSDCGEPVEVEDG